MNPDESASPEAPSSVRGTRASMDRSLAHGIAWIGGVKWLTQVLTWGATIFVARILDPADFGLYAFATSFMGLVILLTEFGIGTAIVTFRGLSEDEVAQVNTLAVLLGVAGLLVSCLVAPILARFYRSPELTAVVIASSSIFLIGGLRVVPQAILQRDLRFRDLALNEGVQGVVTALGSIAFALLGFRYWTLVLSSVLAALVATAYAMRLVRVRFRWPDWSGLREVLTFSQQTIGTRIAWYLYQNADFFIAGRLLGQQALGAYNVGWTFASTPIERVTALAGRVTPSILSAVQQDLREIRRYLLTVTEALALIAFPLSVGLALVADVVVPLLLGEKWIGAIVPLRVLALAAAIRSIAPLFPQVLMVTGANRRVMQVNLFGLLLMPIAFLVGARQGITGVAMAWLLVYPVVVVVPLAVITFRHVRLGWSDYLRVLVPATNAAIVMTVAVLAAKALLPETTPRLLALLTQSGVGAIVYGATLWLLHRDRVLPFLRFARRSAAPAPALAPPPAPEPFYASAPASDTTRRMLLVSYHFPPDSRIGALRWEKMAAYAAERGWTFDVLMIDPQQLELRDDTRLASLPAGLRLFGVHYNSYRESSMEAVLRQWAARILRTQQRLEAAHHETRQRATITPVNPMVEPAAPSDNGTSNRRSAGRLILGIRRAQLARRSYSEWQDWASRAAAVGIALARERPYDMILSSGPPHMSHEAAREVSVATRTPYAMDLRDPWEHEAYQEPESESATLSRLSAEYEAKAVAGASLVVMNTGLAEQMMRERYPDMSDKFITIMNGADEELRHTGTWDSTFVISYTGHIYGGRDPLTLFRGVRRAIDELGIAPGELEVRFMGSEHMGATTLTLLATDTGLRNYFVSEPVQVRQSAVDLLRRSAMVVVLPQKHWLSIPGKVFEYVQTPAWVLSLSAPGSATDLMLRETSAHTIAPDDVYGVSQVVAKHYRDFRSNIRPVPINADGRFDRTRQADKLFRALEKAIEARAVAASAIG